MKRKHLLPRNSDYSVGCTVEEIQTWSSRRAERNLSLYLGLFDALISWCCWWWWWWWWWLLDTTHWRHL